MSNQQPEIGASPTFEVGPSELIAGKDHQLVFTRVREPITLSELRIHALSQAVATREVRFSSDDDEAPVHQRVLETAEAYFGFLAADGEVSA